MHGDWDAGRLSKALVRFFWRRGAGAMAGYHHLCDWMRQLIVPHLDRVVSKVTGYKGDMPIKERAQRLAA